MNFNIIYIQLALQLLMPKTSSKSICARGNVSQNNLELLDLAFYGLNFNGANLEEMGLHIFYQLGLGLFYNLICFGRDKIFFVLELCMLHYYYYYKCIGF